MKESKATRGLFVIYMVIALSVIFSGLLIFTSLSGISNSKKSYSQLKVLDEKAMGPSRDFQQISISVKDVEISLLLLQKSNIKKSKKKRIIKKMKSLNKKITRLIADQVKNSRGKVYENYLKQWFNSYEPIVENLIKKINIKNYNSKEFDIDESIRELNTLSSKIVYMNTFLKSDAEEILKEASTFTENSISQMRNILIIGFSIGLFFTILILHSIYKLLKEIASGRKQVERILNNLNEGFMVLNKDGSIAPGQSRSVEGFFGQSPNGKSFKELLQLDKKASVSLDEWFEALFSGLLDFDDLVNVGPASFEKINNQYISLNYLPIYQENSDEQLDSIICISANETKQRKLELKAEKDQAYAKMIITILKDKPSFLSFMGELYNCLTGLKEELANPENKISLDTLFRYMHTIKGGSGSYHLKDITDTAHFFENELSNIKSEGGHRLTQFLPNLKEGVVKIENLIQEFLTKNESLIGKVDESTLKVKTVDYLALENFIKKLEKSVGSQSPVYKDFVEEFILESISDQFLKFSTVIDQVAKLQSKEVKYEVKESDILIHVPSYGALIGTYVHVFRNAVDHGVEKPQERAKSQKQKTGVITVHFEKAQSQEQSERIRIVVQDDGKGVNPETISKIAIEKNLLSSEEASRMDEKEIIQYIFAPGFSTSDKVSEISGRGVGLDALKYEAKKLGGTAWVETEKGKGSKIIVECPLHTQPLLKPLDRLN